MAAPVSSMALATLGVSPKKGARSEKTMRRGWRAVAELAPPEFSAASRVAGRRRRSGAGAGGDQAENRGGGRFSKTSTRAAFPTSSFDDHDADADADGAAFAESGEEGDVVEALFMEAEEEEFFAAALPSELSPPAAAVAEGIESMGAPSSPLPGPVPPYNFESISSRPRSKTPAAE